MLLSGWLGGMLSARSSSGAWPGDSGWGELAGSELALWEGEAPAPRPSSSCTGRSNSCRDSGVSACWGVMIGEDARGPVGGCPGWEQGHGLS